MTIASKPTLIEGEISVDDRGQVSFINGFDPVAAGIRRQYFVSNHLPRQVRAWHAHRREAKYVVAVSGSALVCAVQVINWKKPRKDVPIHRMVLSASQPAVLAIPPGYANGWMSLTGDARLLWLSTATVEESHGDDVRFPARWWNPWEISER